MKKVPFLLVCGKREAEAGQVAVRERGGADRGAMPIEDVLKEMLMNIERRS